MKIIKLMKKDCFFYILVGIAGCFILFSHPFFKIPYDMWDHMSQIGNMYRENCMYNSWPFFRVGGRGYIWYKFWAEFFHLFKISSPWLWLKIIHILQFSFVALGCYFYSTTIFNLLTPTSNLKKYGAYFATLFWFIGLGFSSVVYHNSWIAWYSLNYQCMSMACFWFGTGLMLKLCFYPKKFSLKSFLPLLRSPKDTGRISALLQHNSSRSCEVLRIPHCSNTIDHQPSTINYDLPTINPYIYLILYVLCLVAIIVVHPLESVYLVIHFILILISAFCYYIFALKKSVKLKMGFIAIGVVSIILIVGVSLGIISIAGSYGIIKVKSFPQGMEIQELYKLIVKQGSDVIKHNKFPRIYSELFILSFIGIVATSFIYLYLFMKKRITLNRKIYIILYLTTCSIILLSITWIKYIGGIITLGVSAEQVYRFIFTAPCFIFFPYIIIELFDIFKNKKLVSKLNNPLYYTMILLTLVALLFGVSALISPYHSFSRNILSMKSLLSQKETLSYSKNTIEKLKSIVDAQTEKNIKYPLYYLRGDMAMALHYYYGLPVYSKGKEGIPLKNKFYWLNGHYKLWYEKRASNKSKKWLSKPIMDKNRPYTLIDITLPENFPRKKIIFDYFDLDENNNKCVISVETSTGTIGEITGETKIFQCIHSITSISKIDILMTNYGRINNKDIFLRIREGTHMGKIVGEEKCNASNIKENSWHTFSFKKYVKLDPYKVYFIQIESPQSTSGNAITIYNDKSIPGGNLNLNGKGKNGNLCMRVYEK